MCISLQPEMNHVTPEKVAEVNHADKNGAADLDIEVSIQKLYLYTKRIIFQQVFIVFMCVCFFKLDADNNSLGNKDFVRELCDVY